MNATTGIQRTNIAPKSGPQVDALYAVGNPSATDFGMVKRKIDGDSAVYALPFESVKEITADLTLTPEDNGKTVVFNTTTSLVVNLPATAKGLRYRFFSKIAAGSGVGHSVSPNAADKIFASGFTTADDKDAVNTQATAAVGDAFEVQADEAGTGWIGEAVAGTWARE